MMAKAEKHYRVPHLVREYPPNLVPDQLEHPALRGRKRLPKQKWEKQERL